MRFKKELSIVSSPTGPRAGTDEMVTCNAGGLRFPSDEAVTLANCHMVVVSDIFVSLLIVGLADNTAASTEVCR